MHLVMESSSSSSSWSSGAVSVSSPGSSRLDPLRRRCLRRTSSLSPSSLSSSLALLPSLPPEVAVDDAGVSSSGTIGPTPASSMLALFCSSLVDGRWQSGDTGLAPLTTTELASTDAGDGSGGRGEWEAPIAGEDDSVRREA